VKVLLRPTAGEAFRHGQSYAATLSTDTIANIVPIWQFVDKNHRKIDYFVVFFCLARKNHYFCR